MTKVPGREGAGHGKSHKTIKQLLHSWGRFLSAFDQETFSPFLFRYFPFCINALPRFRRKKKRCGWKDGAGSVKTQTSTLRGFFVRLSVFSENRDHYFTPPNYLQILHKLSNKISIPSER